MRLLMADLRCRSGRQRFAGLLCHDVFGIPVWPALSIFLAEPALVLAVCGSRPPERVRDISRRRECDVRVHTSRQPRRDLLQQPAVAVRIAECREGPVARAAGGGATEAPARSVEPKLSSGLPGVEDFADLGAARCKRFACGVDIRDDQIKALGGARCRRRQLGAELDRARRTWRRELDDAEAVVEGEVGVEPPAEARVELFRAIDVCNRNGQGLKLQIYSWHTRPPGDGFALRLSNAHGWLLG